MILGIEVLGRETKIRLPLVRDEANWPTTAQLDGIPLPLEWDADSRSCTISVSEPGRYELSISFVPHIRDTAANNRIELTIPPWRGASLELRYPAELKGLEVAGVNRERPDDRSVGVTRAS